MKKQKTLITATIILVALALLPIVSAEFWGCFHQGEHIDYCNPQIQDRTAPHDMYYLCMKNYNEAQGCYSSGSWNKCNQISYPETCSATGGTEFDQTPKELTINSPLEGEIYSDRGIVLNLDPNEIVDIDYKDNNDPRRWKQVCRDCSSYSRERGFNEGLNDLTFRVVDRAGNEAFFDLTFTVDSKAPRIRSVTPNDGFTSGLFVVTFDELSPQSLMIHYGNSQTGFHDKSVNFATECVEDRTTICTTQVDLSNYDGQQIEYYVQLEDVAGSTDTSNVNYLDVDYSDPIITSLNLEKDGRSVIFQIGVDEPYFAEAVYIETSGSNNRENRMCTRLENGICEKKATFSDGNKEVDIIVRDEAGNEARQTISFLVDSKGPRIRSTSPNKGFASGMFDVEFEESTPETLTLNYGNFETGMRSKALNLNNDCTHSGEKYFCSTSVALNDYDGEKIGYTFTVTDIAENTATGGADNLAVDISPPSIVFLDANVDGRYVNFVMEVNEANLKEITYIDHSDPRAREKTLCKRLNDNICQKKVSFTQDGDHDVTVTVYDESGQAVAQSVQFFTDSRDPRIRSVTPSRRDFASGLFEVKFIEQNPTSLVLSYGNDQTGMRSHNFNLNTECTPGDRDETTCLVDLSLNDYDGQEIYYEFTIIDRVGQIDKDGESGIPVDITFPIINSLTYETDDRGRADIMMEVIEQNLDEINYINNNDSRPRERRLCTRLDSNNMCEKTIRLNEGSNHLVFTVLDEAGNSVAQEITIQNG